MSLESTLTDITTRLRQGRFPNEQAISQGIVLRVLQELGWDTWDTTLVWPEFQTGEGRVDFALCHPPSKPAVFIEVKQPGKAEDAVRQALEYAFHTGVPFVVLTDGKTWSFYLPAEQGSYEDRRVYKLDLFERAPAEAAATSSGILRGRKWKQVKHWRTAERNTAAETENLRPELPSLTHGANWWRRETSCLWTFSRTLWNQRLVFAPRMTMLRSSSQGWVDQLSLRGLVAVRRRFRSQVVQA